jgi:metallo-beta-lactamase family protein
MPDSSFKLHFLGAAGTVTGSKYLVEHGGHRVLIDCGLFQGFKQLRLMNWEPFPFDPRAIDAVVLTHAHLDHSGALPLLVQQGFRGPVLATPSTFELCQLLLPDSGRIQEEDADYLNRHHLSRHDPARPLYTEDDAHRSLKRFDPLAFGVRAEVVPGIAATLRPSGHILGAASVALEVGGTTVLFSGDVGRDDDPVMREPARIDPAADHIVVESTYGDRLHVPQGEAESLLADAISRTSARGGVVVIPAFAVGRAQALLLLIHRLKQRGAIPDLPVFLDSPMAIDTTEIYHRHHAEHRMSAEECLGMYKAAKMVRTPEASKALAGLSYPAVIISASGMATGGRVLHHLKHFAPDRRNMVVLAGYQAGGTRGARLQQGERTVRIHGEDVSVRAEIVSLPGMSAHADAAQLLRWLGTAGQPPRSVFITHGEPAASDALRQRIERELGWNASVPRLGQCVEIRA